VDAFFNLQPFNVELKNLDFTYFKDISEEKVFVYLDPPYSNTEAGYNAQWGAEQDKALLGVVLAYLEKEVLFGLSGVDNGKPNLLLNVLKDHPKVKQYWLGDLYKKISKKEKENKEYYLTNFF
jgi:site-specific DNA-adenine methylase